MEKYGLAFTSANLTIWFTIPTPNLASITIKHLLELALPLVLDPLKVPHLPHLNLHLNLHPNLHLNPHLNPHLNQPQQPRNQPQQLRNQLQQLRNQPQLQQPWNQRLQLQDLQPIANTKVKNCLIPEIVINTTGVSLIPIIPFTSKFSLVVIGLLTPIKALVYGQTSTTTSALKLLEDRIPKYNI